MTDKTPQKFSDVLTGLPSKLPGKLGERAERGPVVAAVRLHGVITSTPSPVSRPTISMQNVETALSRAFAHDRLQAVALAINSPGGSPTQSALVAERIRELAKDKDVPVLAFCEDVAASGGYWLACAGDEIYAHGTSMIGSVGVVTAGFGLHGLLDRIGVERRVHAAGENKVRLDPYRPEKDDDVEWLTGMQNELHQQFREWVTARRADRLADSEELFSGEVYTGRKGVDLGLLDGLGTMRSVVREKFPDAHLVSVEPRKPLLARLGVSSPASTGLGSLLGGSDPVMSTVEALEHRALWSRFGL
ncbi:S49 family peptidase [Salinifilum aidingensis]